MVKNEKKWYNNLNKKIPFKSAKTLILGKSERGQNVNLDKFLNPISAKDLILPNLKM